MHNLPRSLLISLVYSFLYNLPIIFLRNSVISNLSLKIIPEFILASFITLTAFYLLKACLGKKVAHIIIFILFLIGGLSNYVVFNYSRFIDIGLIIDALTVNIELSSEFASPYILIYVIVSAFISYIFLLAPKNSNKVLKTYSSKTLLSAMTIVFLVNFAFVNFSFNTLRYMTKDYLPTSIFYNVGYFFVKYLPHFKKINQKNDLTKSHSFELNDDTTSPMTIVLIIGESMRGDIMSFNGYNEYDNTPLLKKVSNLISFPNATSSATSTRISIPYMLTSAIPPNFNQALNEKSVISIFKHLGFTTSWIGNQGAFGFYETTYASNILESDHSVIQDDLRKAFKLDKYNIHDEHLLPMLDSRLNEVKGNHFIVIHLIGSHWNFKKRYPESFGHKFMPICDASHESQCSPIELKNLYHNTITYSDYVLNEIIARLKERNSLVIYASDHGYSLGERNLYGNGYAFSNVPREQISIGMFSWASDKFLQNHLGLQQKIFAKKMHNISHDYIFHTLLDCTGVKSDYIDPNLSLCN